jgi:hypothetical protein
MPLEIGRGIISLGSSRRTSGDRLRFDSITVVAGRATSARACGSRDWRHGDHGRGHSRSFLELRLWFLSARTRRPAPEMSLRILATGSSQPIPHPVVGAAEVARAAQAARQVGVHGRERTPV